MKVEFNRNGFSAETGHDSDIFCKTIRSTPELPIFKKYACLILGAFALFLSLSLAPFGLLINIMIDVFQQISTHIPIWYLWSLGWGWGILAVISVVFSVISTVCYVKSEKHAKNTIGLIFSIVALVFCIISFSIGIATMPI